MILINTIDKTFDKISMNIVDPVPTTYHVNNPELYKTLSYYINITT